MKHNVSVTKSNGQKNRFSEQKLRRSLEKAGADREQTDQILTEIGTKLYDGIPTKQIYKLAFSLLKSNSKHLAARYHLKNAIMELGPSGFPFEKYISGILSAQGYNTKIGQTLQGICVNHEIDVIAEKYNHFYIVECKYHNQRGIFCDVKIPLYIQARFKDVEEQLIKTGKNANKIYQGWVVTNTKFSTDAIRYGQCAGLNLLSWDYPVENGLKDQIDALGLYPITCLTTLTKSEKQTLLGKNTVLCRELLNEEKMLSRMGINANRIEAIILEAGQLCERLHTHLKLADKSYA